MLLPKKIPIRAKINKAITKKCLTKNLKNHKAINFFPSEQRFIITPSNLIHIYLNIFNCLFTFYHILPEKADFFASNFLLFYRRKAKQHFYYYKSAVFIVLLIYQSYYIFTQQRFNIFIKFIMFITGKKFCYLYFSLFISSIFLLGRY